jgi:hypothetical protein
MSLSRLIVVLLLIVQLCAIHAQSAASRGCEFAGYLYMEGYRPVGASVAFFSTKQKSSVAQAVAACNASPICTMFTTDGWLMRTNAYFWNGNPTKYTPRSGPSLVAELRTTGNVVLGCQRPYCGAYNNTPGCHPPAVRLRTGRQHMLRDI